MAYQDENDLVEPWKIPRVKVQVAEEIGRGGWGSVSKGRLQVAIKQLHPAIISPHCVQLLHREVKILAQVRHPNLVQFVGAIYDDHEVPSMIIVELLDTNLRLAYERKELPSDNRLSIFQDIARALNYLHQRDEPIIHRDVSAPNVLLERVQNGRWKGKLSDLGSANFAKDATTAAPGAILYSAPESLPQFKAFYPNAQQTPKIDVYSYGILLCEVIAARLPESEHYQGMLLRVKQEWPFMHSLIDWCTKSAPGERPSMRLVLSNLERVLSGEQVVLQELVAVEQRPLVELEPKETVDKATYDALLAEVDTLRAALDDVRGQLQIKSNQVDNLTHIDEGKELQIAGLERQLQARRESEQRLMDKLEKEHALNHELFTAKTDDETQLDIVRQQVADRDAELVASRAENEAISAELADLKGQLQIKSSQVSFTNIQKTYPPGEKLVISYGLHTEMSSSSRDWVGLFRVGWTESRDYYTFEWAPTPQEQQGQVVFAGRRLPPEDGHFYQVCYVTSDGRVRGASPPFQFLAAENEAIRAELADLKGQLQSKSSQVDDLIELASARGEELHIKRAETEQVVAQLKARNRDIERLQCEHQRLQQELTIAQENITELMGAGPNVAIANQPSQEPPTQAEPKASVDKAVYDALLQAYDNMEDYYQSAMKDNEMLHKQLQETKAAYQEKNDELTARVEQCRLEYEAKKPVVEIAEIFKTTPQPDIEAFPVPLPKASPAKLNLRKCPVCDTTFPARIPQSDFERHVQGHFGH